MKSKLLILSLSFLVTQGLFAQQEFNSSVLIPFPPIGSVEDKEDIDQLLFFQKTRTADQCEAAQTEANANLESFFGEGHKLLSANELANVKKKIKWLTVKTGAKIFYYKTQFARLRPYITHPEIKPCIELESSKAYPSGHAALARVYARILSVMYPERSLLFLKRSNEVALNRVIGGVHHPSDVAAGIILGDAIADDYLNDGDFRYMLAI